MSVDFNILLFIAFGKLFHKPQQFSFLLSVIFMNNRCFSFSYSVPCVFGGVLVHIKKIHPGTEQNEKQYLLIDSILDRNESFSRVSLFRSCRLSRHNIKFMCSAPIRYETHFFPFCWL